MASDGRTRLVVELPTDLKKDFKLCCTLNDVPMSWVLEKLIRNYLTEQEWEGTTQDAEAK